jgi:hypothetical protein
VDGTRLCSCDMAVLVLGVVSLRALLLHSGSINSCSVVRVMCALCVYEDVALCSVVEMY